MSRQLINQFILAVLLLSSNRTTYAQSQIQGTVTDETGKPLKDASVLLVRSADSVLVKGMISNGAGKYEFEDISKGDYRLSASFTGMQTSFSPAFEISGNETKKEIPALALKSGTTTLKGVTVDVKKPMFEQKVDRMVINVKNSITDAGGTALEVLAKSPGVTVNLQNNTIAINGKNGVVVMINGKISYMPMDAMVQLLSGISASNIEKIELITTPPAKYDAEGNAGYINIVLINNPNQGLSGSYFLAAGYGNDPLGSAGINFNYRSSKVNIYGDYNFNYTHAFQPGTSFTQLTKSGAIVADNSYTNRNTITSVHNIRLGADYQVDSSTVLGALISGYDSRWTMTAHNGSNVQTNGIIDTTINTIDHEINHWQNAMANLNLQHTFQPGKVLFIDANYISYKDNNPNTYSNVFYKGLDQLLYQQDQKTGKTTPIDFEVFSSDYTTPIGKKITMEAGAKVSLSRFTNNVSMENLKQGSWESDSSLSANYKLKENIGAAYASFTMNPNAKTSVKAGLRYEYTTSNLGTQQTANIVNRKYGELFPTFYISQKLDDNNSLNFSYSRRITRPTFNDLAPFTIFFTPKSYFTGNPALQPAIANAVQASYVFKNFIFSVSYTHEDFTIASFQAQSIDTSTNIVYYSAQNSKYQQYVTGSISLPFTVTKWWTMQNNINIDWLQVNASFGNLPILVQTFDFNINSTQHFSLSKDYALEVTGFYTSGSYYGTNKFQPIYQVDAGLQKKCKNKKDVLRIAANDMFNTGGKFVFQSIVPVAGTIVRANVNFAQVAYKITWTHSFGNKALKEKRDRSTGAEDELNRVHR